MRFDAAFDEVRRVGEPWGGNWAEMRRRWLAGEALDGWETQEAAFSRFGAGVGRALAESADAIVSTHGLVLTNWLVRRGLVPEAQAVAFWEDLAFPDLLLVDLDRQQVSRPSGP